MGALALLRKSTRASISLRPGKEEAANMARIVIDLEEVSEADVVRVSTTLLIMVPFMTPDEAVVTVSVEDDEVEIEAPTEG